MVGPDAATMMANVTNLAWFGPLKGLQKLFFRTPMVHAFILGSEAYHDYYRWPLKDRRVFEQWREATPWGRLFQEYERRGVSAGPVATGA